MMANLTQAIGCKIKPMETEFIDIKMVLFTKASGRETDKMVLESMNGVPMNIIQELGPMVAKMAKDN